MKKPRLALTLSTVIALGALGCNPFAPDTVSIRVQNASERTMAHVLVQLPVEEGSVDYGTLAPGEASDYRPVRGAYRYAAVRTVVESDTLALTPIDYVGESPLEPGRYTYRLNLFEDRSLILVLVED